MILLTLFSQVEAAACVCGRGSGGLPSGEPVRAWAGSASVEYGASLSGNMDLWNGFYLKDRLGDSMAGMFMPPHLVQSASASFTLGLPAQFSLSASLPYLIVAHLGHSEMPGDVDVHAFADAELAGRWSHRIENGFFGLSAGLTLPTGVVSVDGVATGRGVLGMTGSGWGGIKLSPKLVWALQGSWAFGFGPDRNGYTLAPTLTLLSGVKWWPRENGKLNLSLYAMERWSGKDTKDALVYQNSGFLITDLAGALSYTFWADKMRSAAVTVKAQSPVLQVVGDPMYAENFTTSLGVSMVLF